MYRSSSGVERWTRARKKLSSSSASTTIFAASASAAFSGFRQMNAGR
jgi:hypothetical protein